eukprot:SAG22_NODE_87_length_21437_cov_14.162480_17_plen_95_part_00
MYSSVSQRSTLRIICHGESPSPLLPVCLPLLSLSLSLCVCVNLPALLSRLCLVRERMHDDSGLKRTRMQSTAASMPQLLLQRQNSRLGLLQLNF